MAPDPQRRIAFRFPGGREEVRYLERTPLRGDAIRGVDNGLFVVSRCDRDNGGWVASCVTADDFLLELPD